MVQQPLQAPFTGAAGRGVNVDARQSDLLSMRLQGICYDTGQARAYEVTHADTGMLTNSWEEDHFFSLIEVHPEKMNYLTLIGGGLHLVSFISRDFLKRSHDCSFIT